ncbi:MAG: cupredoxin domain-containing protein [Syntrophobacteraceae bacterium]
MLQNRVGCFMFLLFCSIAMAGCAGGKAQTAAPMSSGGSLISIEAGSYKFSPNTIRVEKTGTVALEIKNISGSGQNFTLKDPRGKLITSIDIRSGATFISNVELTERGTYEFSSNKKLKAGLGMKGRIIVSGS